MALDGAVPFLVGGNMQEFAKGFYKSKTWQKCRESYAKSVGGLCEKCLKQGRIEPGVIVHHKTHINPETISDPTITLNFDNLELLCRKCHGEEHGKIVKRYEVDEMGRVKII